MIFKDKTIIITGGSEGVGAATARLFADAGANLMLVARGKKKLEAIAAELRDKTRVEVFAMDVTDDEACANVFKKADFEFGRVDILINNAGFHVYGDVAKVQAEDLAKTVDVCLRAPILLTRTALPYLEEAGGVIINVGSLAGRTYVPGNSAYAAAKAGLRTFTYSLAEELHGSNIRVAVISPGPIETGFIMSDIDSTSSITLSQPMSTAEQVAQAIVDLCGNDQREIAMPTISRFLTSAVYMMPWLARLVRPALEKKGERVRKEIKARQRATENGE